MDANTSTLKAADWLDKWTRKSCERHTEIVEGQASFRPEGMIKSAFSEIDRWCDHLELAHPHEKAGPVVRRRLAEVKALAEKAGERVGTTPEGRIHAGDRFIDLSNAIADLVTLIRKTHQHIASGDGPSDSEAHASIEAENVFKKDGDTWRVKYGKRRASGLNDLKGMGYIRQLLSSGSSGRSLSLRELIAAVDGTVIKSEGEEADQCMDDEYLKNLRDEMTELDGEIQQARKNNDLAAQERAEQKQEELRGFLRRDTRPSASGTKIKRFKDDADKRADQIRNAVARARKSIGEHIPELAHHLESIKIGRSECKYTGSKTWETF